MGVRKHDYEQVIKRACEIALDVSSLAALSDAIGINRKSLEAILLTAVTPELGETVFEAFQRYAATVFLDTETGSLIEQLSFYKKRTKALEKELHNRQAWFDNLRETVSVLKTKPVPVPHLQAGTQGKTDHVVVLDCSDWHYGADTVKTGQLGIFPVYNPEIARAAITAVFERAIGITKKWESFMNIITFVVNLKGDLVEQAYLREGHRGRVAFGPPRQVFEILQIINANVKLLASHFPKVIVTDVGGNHGRTAQKAGAGLPNESFDWLIGKTLGMLMENQENVEVYTPDCWYILLRIWDSLVLSFHGEDIRSWAGVPWYGISRAAMAITAMMSMETKARLAMLDREKFMALDEFRTLMLEPDVISVAHFHTPQDWIEMGINVIANGALPGVTEYSAKRIRRMTMPSQKMLAFSPKHRLPVLAPNIYVDDIVRAEGIEMMPEAPIVTVA